MASHSTSATYAEYFRMGIETGLLENEQAIEWAMAIIEKMGNYILDRTNN
jgi:hypothetical protein